MEKVWFDKKYSWKWILICLKGVLYDENWQVEYECFFKDGKYDGEGIIWIKIYNYYYHTNKFSSI